MKPLIGLSGRRWPAARLGDFLPAAMRDLSVDLHFSDYGRSVALAGGVPVELTRDADVHDIVELLDGLVLSGGADIDPSHYGAEAAPELGEVEPERDEWEISLYRVARAKGIPILGICRGFQLINVAHGGSLVQDVSLHEGAGHPQWDRSGRERTHDVSCVGSSVVASLVGEGLMVNSLHHQILDRLGQGLIATAKAPDGAIEAFETADARVLGVQWHPELLDAPDPTFTWLVGAARLK